MSTAIPETSFMVPHSAFAKEIAFRFFHETGGDGGIDTLAAIVDEEINRSAETLGDLLANRRDLFIVMALKLGKQPESI